MISIPIDQEERPIEEKLRRYLNPKYGRCVFFAGGKGSGKTHEIVNYIYHITQDLRWHVITNIQFEKTRDLPDCPECGEKMDVSTNGKECVYCGHEEDEGRSPQNIHFVNTMTSFWKEFAHIRIEEAYTPVVFIIDEFHTTVNRLESHKYWNIVTNLVSWLSQMRKFNQAALFCTQWLKQVPEDPRNYANYFIVKNKRLSNQITLNDKYVGKRYLSFVVPVKSMEVKILDPFGRSKHKEAKKFRIRHLNRDLESVVKSEMISSVLISSSCQLNEEGAGEWQYRHRGVSVLEFDEIGGDECFWFKLLIRKLGEVGASEVGDAILEFFDDYKSQRNEGPEMSLDDFSRSELAYFLYEQSDESLAYWADIFGIRRQSVHEAALTDEERYWLMTRFLKVDEGEALDRLGIGQISVSQSGEGGEDSYNRKKEKEASPL